MKFTAINFTCPSCGAPQRFSPLHRTLTCAFCHTQHTITPNNKEIQEYDFHKAISTLQTNKTQSIDKKVHCQQCGGDFVLTPYAFSSHCPYCNTPAIIDFIQEITPQSLIPFQIDRKQALIYFQKWVKSRWFAPRIFKQSIHEENIFTGYYLPYWTYDSKSITSYTGLRGTTYYVTVNKTIIDNGQEKQIQTQEARIRWIPTSGTVDVDFDDVTIGASKTVSRAILDALEPWNTEELMAYDEKYLLGFEAEEYTVGLDNGFEFAKAKMAKKIEKSIHLDIGGDIQKISTMNIQHQHVTYKNVLFPIWTASFQWKNKEYRYAMNAQTAKIIGERPYDYMKIIAIVIACISFMGIVTYMENEGMLEVFFNTSNISGLTH